MSARYYRLAAEEARRLLDSYGLEGEEREITAASETSLPELLEVLHHAEIEDEARIAACRQRAQELRLRAERIQSRIDRRREEIAELLEQAGISKLETGPATFALTTIAPAVQIVEPEALPRDYLSIKTSTTPDRVKIGQALRAGRAVPGAVLSNPRRTIQVRRT